MSHLIRIIGDKLFESALDCAALSTTLTIGVESMKR